MKLLWSGILAWAMLGVPVANSNVWSPMTDLEAKQLPNYCMFKYREQQGDTGGSGKGVALLGPQYGNVHHYCGGLNYLNRYYKNMSRQGAESYLAFAISEFNYMVDHMYPKSPIGAEIFLNRGIAYSLAKNDAKAMSDLQRALSLDPKLARAYITIADQYVKQKNRKKALDVVTEGLRHVPDNRALKRRYDELGGKQPYPEPAVAKQSLVPAETESQAKAEASTATQQSGATEAVADEASPKAAEAQRADPPPIGSPNNPYCRFCPD